jgi:CDP-diacylglycerol--glycerol-3-phosphate 3-phosphatidyltransferase/archaetidylinositol phosphate synthase
MIDGRYGAKLAPLWERLARVLMHGGWSPNAVTITGLILVAGASIAYILHRDELIFAVSLAVAFAFDGLDGALARLTGRISRFGGYLDAVIDRYQEILLFAAIAWVRDLWPLAFLLMSGALLTSYNKARTALEIVIDNADWPDLIERLERVLVTIALLIADRLLPQPSILPASILASGLMVLAVLTHFTALQRFVRAKRRIMAFEARAASNARDLSGH